MSERDKRKALVKAQHIVHSTPSPELYMDKIKRETALRTLTAILMGDPPPGYSALDQRHQSAKAID